MSALRQLWKRALRAGFRLLYNELAWSYDAVSALVSRGQWSEWQAAALPFVTGERILEVAHGPGHLLLRLTAAGRSTVGIDLSPTMSRRAGRRLAQAGRPVRLARARAQALPFAAGSFDCALATFPADFIRDPMTLRELRRVLVPAGRLVIVPEARLTGRGLAARGLEWLYRFTGQRPTGDAPLAAPERQAGPAESGEALFIWRSVQVPLAGSVVTVVVGRRALDRARPAGTMPP
jgi:SAM-dependent methyltransferase